jgi:hypothetical protein
MYYALVQDEEEWQRADQETRDNYWIIGNMKFPIPFELGVMFKVLPERIMAYTMGEDTGEQVRASIARQVLGTLSFNPIPQAVLPLIEASSNYSFFLQRDIVGMGKKDLAPEFQTSEGTSQIAIQLGQTLGISPMKIDYVIRGYTGAMGTYAISTMDSIIRSEDDATKATWRLDQIPVLKRFMISDLGAGTVNEYYDLREKLDEVVRTSNQLERTGNIEALQDYLKENGQVLGMKDYIRSLDKDMKSLRESRMAINMSRMEPDQKREALDSLRRAEISLTERIGLLRSNGRGRLNAVPPPAPWFFPKDPTPTRNASRTLSSKGGGMRRCRYLNQHGGGSSTAGWCEDRLPGGSSCGCGECRAEI